MIENNHALITNFDKSNNIRLTKWSDFGRVTHATFFIWICTTIFWREKLGYPWNVGQKHIFLQLWTQTNVSVRWKNITPPVFGWSINIILFLSNLIMELIHWKKLLKYKIIHSGKGFFGNLPSIKGRYYSLASFPECQAIKFLIL